MIPFKFLKTQKKLKKPPEFSNNINSNPIRCITPKNAKLSKSTSISNSIRSNHLKLCISVAQKISNHTQKKTWSAAAAVAVKKGKEISIQRLRKSSLHHFHKCLVYRHWKIKTWSNEIWWSDEESYRLYYYCFWGKMWDFIWIDWSEVVEIKNIIDWGN